MVASRFGYNPLVTISRSFVKLGGDCRTPQSHWMRDRSVKPFESPAFLRGIEKSMIRKISDRARPGSISLGLGEPDLPTPEVIRRAAVRVIQEEQNGYTLQAGIPELRKLVSSDYSHLKLPTD